MADNQIPEKENPATAENEQPGCSHAYRAALHACAEYYQAIIDENRRIAKEQHPEASEEEIKGMAYDDIDSFMRG